MPHDRPPGLDLQDNPPVLDLRGGADGSDRDQPLRAIRGGKTIVPAELRTGQRVSRHERRSSMRPTTPSNTTSAPPDSTDARALPTPASMPPAKRHGQDLGATSNHTSHIRMDTMDFLECIFQVCVIWCVIGSTDDYHDLKKTFEDKCASILGRPITIVYHDGLTFAIGHDRHREVMVTGWAARPSQLDERLDGDPSNKIRIEPRSENFFKADLSEAEVKDLEWNGEDVERLFEEDLGLLHSEFAPVTCPEVGEDAEADTGIAKSTSTAQGFTMRRTTSRIPLPTPEVRQAIAPNPILATKLTMRVRSNETDNSEGQSIGELEDQWPF
ncbi:hypothetical protein FLONG3_8113 [Fusarium longipes]|uniref:Uncharacterized protein n=1 Tax=Fusarium longipes TaxID=694270 RepID=A0A395S813_9HYPO|nr:hypothetical protein FLONG3_8113 [Fusarium longipes]